MIRYGGKNSPFSSPLGLSLSGYVFHRQKRIEHDHKFGLPMGPVFAKMLLRWFCSASLVIF